MYIYIYIHIYIYIYILLLKVYQGISRYFGVIFAGLAGGLGLVGLILNGRCWIGLDVIGLAMYISKAIKYLSMYISLHSNYISRYIKV
jgi:hypothetical protein